MLMIGCLKMSLFNRTGHNPSTPHVTNMLACLYQVFVISKEDLFDFFKSNPSIRVKMHNVKVFTYALENVIR